MRRQPKGLARGLQTALFHAGVLRLGARGELVLILAAHPGIEFANDDQDPPERKLSTRFQQAIPRQRPAAPRNAGRASP